MSDLSIGTVVRAAKRRNGTRQTPSGSDLTDYADLGDADLPPDAATHLADMTGEPVERFGAGEYDHPDLDELEGDHE